MDEGIQTLETDSIVCDIKEAAIKKEPLLVIPSAWECGRINDSLTHRIGRQATKYQICKRTLRCPCCTYFGAGISIHINADGR